MHSLWREYLTLSTENEAVQTHGTILLQINLGLCPTLYKLCVLGQDIYPL